MVWWDNTDVSSDVSVNLNEYDVIKHLITCHNKLNNLENADKWLQIQLKQQRVVLS
ncbi:MAG: hypothetical protein MUP85_11925 [Candidatus Lokiarchaeota archaeon]|nr:hypothetical protein [Candidatus Lokiarchaeota archaeon]